MKPHRYLQLADMLIKKIENNMLSSNERLPSIRQLCQQNEVSKNTVLKALHTLETNGWVEARPRMGFFVKNRRHQEKSIQLPSQPILPEPKEVEMSELFLEIMKQGAAFDFLPSGEPMSPSKHLLILNRSIASALRKQTYSKAMYYDQPLGSEMLRFQIKERYRSTGLDLSANDYCITAGCQNALFMALSVSCQPGDNVAVESPAFYGVLQLLEQLKLNVIEIPASPVEGINIESLQAAAEKWNIKACVLTPAFATPTGACIPQSHKQCIIDLANKKDLVVIEDDIYGELGFHQRPTTLKSLDTEERVILCSSFSKSLSRDLRIGWVSGGRWHDKITQFKLVSQLACNQATQQGVADFIAEGHFRRHLNHYRFVLKLQRDQLISNLEGIASKSIRFCIPEGGLVLWLQLDKEIDSAAIYRQALKQDIFLTPGVLFSLSKHYKNYLRLSFAHPMESTRQQAIKKLGCLLANNHS